MTIRIKRWLLILAVLVVLRTILAIPHRNGEFYISMRSDIHGIDQLLHPTGFQLFEEVMRYGKYPALVLVACDIPLAILADSFLLPYDFYIGRQKGFFMRIIDDRGNPVPKATVYGGGKNTIRGETDDQGLYRWASDSRSIEMFRISKPGYYETKQEPRLYSTVYTELKDSHTNVLPIVLKRIRNPVPMYAKRASVDLPSDSGSYGYDLMVGDLVTPYGKGQVVDILFSVKKGAKRHGLDLDITFSSASDGIQLYEASREGWNPELRQSAYIFPYEAPIDSYTQSLALADSATDARLTEKEQWKRRYDMYNYLFRVRSTSTENGLYGRIYGCFRGSIRGTDIPNVEFTYFLNPDGTRNLEWDPKENLITEMSRYRTRESEPRVK